MIINGLGQRRWKFVADRNSIIDWPDITRGTSNTIKDLLQGH